MALFLGFKRKEGHFDLKTSKMLLLGNETALHNDAVRVLSTVT